MKKMRRRSCNGRYIRSKCQFVLTMLENILPPNCKHLWRGSCVRFGDFKQRCQYRYALSFSWLTLSDTLSFFYTTSTKSAIFWERPSSQESNVFFWNTYTLLKQSINAIFFSYEYENRQLNVITCRLFLNDLYFLFKKKNCPSVTFIGRLCNVSSAITNVRNVFFNFLIYPFLAKINKGKQLILDKVQIFKKTVLRKKKQKQ